MWVSSWKIAACLLLNPGGLCGERGQVRDLSVLSVHYSLHRKPAINTAPPRKQYLTANKDGTAFISLHCRMMHSLRMHWIRSFKLNRWKRERDVRQWRLCLLSRHLVYNSDLLQEGCLLVSCNSFNHKEHRHSEEIQQYKLNNASTVLFYWNKVDLSDRVK